MYYNKEDNIMKRLDLVRKVNNIEMGLQSEIKSLHDEINEIHKILSGVENEGQEDEEYSRKLEWLLDDATTTSNWISTDLVELKCILKIGFEKKGK